MSAKIFLDLFVIFDTMLMQNMQLLSLVHNFTGFCPKLQT